VKILAIRLARFGDIVLLLPALSRLKAAVPGSHLTFLTDERWRDLAAMCPAIDDIYTIDRVGIRDGSYVHAIGSIFRVGSELRRRNFDAVIDFHGFRETNLMAWWTRAPKRLGLKRADQSALPFCFNLPPVLEDKTLHVSEMFNRVAQAFTPTRDASHHSALVLPEDALHWAGNNAPAGTYAVLYVDAPVQDRMWPLERFAAVADHIERQLGGSVIVVTGSDKKLRGLPASTRVFSTLTSPQLSAIIARAKILVSNDTGPMHLGPALGIPTVGLFSVGLPTHFRPNGPFDVYVQGNPIDAIAVREVVEAVERVWSATGR
jgi:heptosyltransferase-2